MYNVSPWFSISVIFPFNFLFFLLCFPIKHFFLTMFSVKLFIILYLLKWLFISVVFIALSAYFFHMFQLSSIISFEPLYFFLELFFFFFFKKGPFVSNSFLSLRSAICLNSSSVSLGGFFRDVCSSLAFAYISLLLLIFSAFCPVPSWPLSDCYPSVNGAVDSNIAGSTVGRGANSLGMS